MIMSRHLFALPILALLALPATAQTPAPAAPATSAATSGADTKTGRGAGGGPLAACRADVDKICATAEKVQGWRGKCLRENAAKLSPECTAAIGRMRELRQKVSSICADDIKTHCAKDAETRPMSCLKQNETKLASGCKAAMAEAFATDDTQGDAADPAAKK